MIMLKGMFVISLPIVELSFLGGILRSLSGIVQFIQSCRLAGELNRDIAIKRRMQKLHSVKRLSSASLTTQGNCARR